MGGEFLGRVVTGQVGHLKPVLKNEEYHDCGPYYQEGTARAMVSIDDQYGEENHRQDILLVNAREPHEQDADVFEHLLHCSLEAQSATHAEEWL